MLVLESCCCGLISLKDGTRIISGLSILSALIYIVLIILALIHETTHMVKTLLFLVLVIVVLAFSLMTFFDTFKERPLPSFLIPFLIVQTIFVVVEITSIVVVIWLDISQGGLKINNKRIGTIAALVFEIIGVISGAIHYYLVLVVYSYYKELQKGTLLLSSPRPA